MQEHPPPGAMRYSVTKLIVYAWSDFQCWHYLLCSLYALFILCSLPDLRTIPLCSLDALFILCSLPDLHTIRSAHYPLRSLSAPLTIRSAHYSLRSLTIHSNFSLPDLCTIRSTHYPLCSLHDCIRSASKSINR